MRERMLTGRAGDAVAVLQVAVVTALAMVAMISGIALGARPAAAQNSAATATPSSSCPAATPAADTQNASLCVGIGEYDIHFTPNLVTIPADTPVRVVLANHGTTMHNFSITDHKNGGVKNLDVSVNTDPGKTTETTINAPEGTYYFFCNVPGHEAAGMFGYLQVKKDAKIATEDATVTPPAG